MVWMKCDLCMGQPCGVEGALRYERQDRFETAHHILRLGLAAGRNVQRHQADPGVDGAQEGDPVARFEHMPQESDVATTHAIVANLGVHAAGSGKRDWRV
jgi:hypothetical protein